MKSTWAIRYLLVLTGFIVFAACSDKKERLTETKVIDNICYRIDFLPDYAKRSIQHDSVELADLDYYRFSISEEKINGKIADLFKPSNYNKLLYYLNRNIESDFKSIRGTDELAPVQVFFESNNRISNKIIFLLAFEKNRKSKESIIVFNDNIFDNGFINFKYDTSDLNTL